MTFSPDGQAVAYVAQGQGQGIIMLRRLDSERPRPLAGTDGAQDIHFSPDSKRIAYFKNGAIWLAAFDGSAPTELLTIGAWNGITWTGPKEIVYEVSDTLWSVDVGSRAKRIVTTLDLATKEVDLNGPFGLPDGKTVAFIVSDRHDWTGVNHLAFVATDGSHRTVTPIVTRWVAAYHDGWLFYASEAKALTAIRIDLSGHASSDPVQLMDTTQVSSGRTALSAGGDLAFVRGATEREIAIFGPRGESLTGLHEGQFYTTPTWSPDGRRVAFVMPVPGASASATGIWIFDPAAGRSARLSTRKSALRPAWSPDGKQLAFIGVGDSAQSFQSAWTIAADGSGGEKLLYSTAGRVREVVYTPDGRSVVMTVDATATPKNGRDLVVMSLGDSKVTPIVATSADEYQPAVSSDGRWLAYTSNESGKPEVYVRPMNGSGSSAVMSKGGGAEPRWTHDGRIVYRSSSAAFYRVTLTTVGGLAAAGQRDSLLLPSAIRYDMHQNYDIAGDGRYVVVRNANSDADVFVVTNWWEKVKDRLK